MRTGDLEALATVCADLIRAGYQAYNDEFRGITRRARARFEQRAWEAGRRDAVERIELYGRHVTAGVEQVRQLLGAHVQARTLWRAVRQQYPELVARDPDPEFARTYFNSVSRRVFETVGVDPEVEFCGDEAMPLRNAAGPKLGLHYAHDGTLAELFAQVFADYAWSAPYADAQACAAAVAGQVEQHYQEQQNGDTVLCVDLFEEVFYRDTRAYLVGKVTGWTRVTPLVIALGHDEDGVRVDSVLQAPNQVSALFGFARSYFHVDFEAVGPALLALREIMPRKSVHEMFTVLGRAKQGKAERYRDFVRHLEFSRDRFIPAPGKRGMVMLVFTLPSYDIVFKLIRDRFAPPKDTTREQVRARYDLVFRHDKAGRLVDAQEYRGMSLPKERFAPELLDELLSSTAGAVRVESDCVVIDHLYVERRLRPLDLFVREASRAAARHVVLDYGQALRELAYHNIFPGDLLLKNFGVTRSGRVIFYDYDELRLLTECSFRDIPEPRTPEDEMSAEPWYYVGPDDVFPEEFPSFLGLDPELRACLVQAHGDLFTAAFWRSQQERARRGELVDILP